MIIRCANWKDYYQIRVMDGLSGLVLSLLKVIVSILKIGKVYNGKHKYQLFLFS